MSDFKLFANYNLQIEMPPGICCLCCLPFLVLGKCAGGVKSVVLDMTDTYYPVVIVQSLVSGEGSRWLFSHAEDDRRA